jgi:hypothetical protein
LFPYLFLIQDSLDAVCISSSDRVAALAVDPENGGRLICQHIHGVISLTGV